MEISDTPIAAGRTAEVYAWQKGRVLKLLRPGFPTGLIQKEVQITNAVYQLGMAAPKIYGVVEVNGRPGIVFERIDGPSLTAVLERHPLQIRQHAGVLARLHADIHTHTITHPPEGTPRQKQILASQVQAAEVLPKGVRDSVLSLLERLPDGDTMCHNDFHSLNVLIGASGPVIIDWESASLGSPCADVARTSLTVALGRPPEGFPNFLIAILAEIILRNFVSNYLKQYQIFSHNPLDDLNAWQTVQAAAKVQWETPANQEMWIKVIEKGLKQRI